MNTTNTGAVESTRVWANRTTTLRRAAVVLLLAGVMFISTGCYDDRYYGHRPVRGGYYASYAGPAPYYGHDPYGYGGYGYDGYGTGVGIGISSYRGRSRYHRGYYGQRNYGPSGYYRRSWDDRRGDGRRYWDGRGDGRRNWDGRGGGRRNWDRRGDDDRDRRSNRRRRARSERGSEVRRSAPPYSGEGEPVERQPE